MKRIVLISAISLFPVFANAQNMNNRINAEEVKQMVYAQSAEVFKKMDANDNKNLSKTEYIQYVMEENRKTNEAEFKKMDKNNDNIISNDEFNDFIIETTNATYNALNQK